MGLPTSYLSYNLATMAPKDPVTTPAFPGAEVHSAPAKDVTSTPIIPIVPEPVKDAVKGGVDLKKSKTESKKKVSGTAKVDVFKSATEVKVDVVKSATEVKVAEVDVVKSATEVKVAEVVAMEAKVEQSCVIKEVSIPSAAKLEVKVPDAPPVIASIPNMKPAEVSVPSVQPTPVDQDDVVILKETISKKFGEITFSDYG